MKRVLSEKAEVAAVGDGAGTAAGAVEDGAEAVAAAGVEAVATVATAIDESRGFSEFWDLAGAEAAWRQRSKQRFSSHLRS